MLLENAAFIAAAKEEFLAEVAYYNLAQEGLGSRFSLAVEKALLVALAFPKSGSPCVVNTRRVAVRGFPFWLVYLPTDSGILVFALAHQSRRTNYWLSRSKG